jgi:uncharacterized repeat protein (TIGR01451 family)
VDVTDKNTPVQLSRTGYSNSAYTHQGWLTENHAYFLSNDELDERNNESINFTRTHLWDVANLDAPIYLGFYQASVQSIDHNLYIHNGLVYTANYTTGLRVLDYSDIANGNLTEVAYIDTHPSMDSLTSFDGAWSSYPFFASGTVIIGDRDEGLIVVRVLQAELTASVMDSPDPVVEGFQLDYTIDITNNGPGPASSVTLTDVLPAGVGYVQATPSQGGCSETGGTVTCLLGILADGASATVTVTVTAITPGSWSNVVSVIADEIDSNMTDNEVTLDNTVLPDQDGDGLDDDFETSIGTNPLLPDTDGDGLSDGDEVGYDGDFTQYIMGQDTDPLDADTDNDGLDDGMDPIPLTTNVGDGDLAPWNAPDGAVNAADKLIALQIVLGLRSVGGVQLAHGDLFPVGAPDGAITLQDLILLEQLLLP